MPEVQILSPRPLVKNLTWLQHQARFLFFVVGALVALWSLFTPLPSFLVDLLVCVALAAGVSSLATPMSSLPDLLVGLAIFRVGLGLALLRASLSGASAGLAASIGATISGAAGLLFVIVSAMILGLFLGKAAARAAEVSARFALDSLPGGQAAIEAEAKNNADPLQQKNAREALLHETRGRGAADGAAKLLTGDALLAPLFGVVAALMPLTQNQEASMQTGAGVALLLLAAAIPPAAALAFGVVSSAPRRALIGPLLGGASMLPLLLVPQAPLLAPLLVMLGCAVLFWVQPKSTLTQPLELLLPLSAQKTWRVSQEVTEQKLGFRLPPMKESFTARTDCELRLYNEPISQQASLEELLEDAAPKLFSLEEAQEVLQKLRAQFPVSASLIQAPLTLLHQIMRQALSDGLPLAPKALAEAFSTLPGNAMLEPGIESIRLALRPYLLHNIGQPPVVIRLAGFIEDELRQGRPLDQETIEQLKQQQSAYEQERPGRLILLLCHKEARLMIASLLRKKQWRFLVSDELPPELELDFLGELSA
jgi:flagellar biosynthesis component FlhA